MRAAAAPCPHRLDDKPCPAAHFRGGSLRASLAPGQNPASARPGPLSVTPHNIAAARVHQHTHRNVSVIHSAHCIYGSAQHRRWSGSNPIERMMVITSKGGSTARLGGGWYCACAGATAPSEVIAVSAAANPVTTIFIAKSPVTRRFFVVTAGLSPSQTAIEWCEWGNQAKTSAALTKTVLSCQLDKTRPLSSSVVANDVTSRARTAPSSTTVPLSGLALRRA